MKSKNAKNNFKKQNYTWEPAYNIKRKSNNNYTVNKRVETTSAAKVFSAIIAVILVFASLTVIYYFMQDNKVTESMLKVADSYIFIGLTTFIIFLVFKTNKKEYNKNKKGVK